MKEGGVMVIVGVKRLTTKSCLDPLYPLLLRFDLLLLLSLFPP
jgi:hypothetical protein